MKKSTFLTIVIALGTIASCTHANAQKGFYISVQGAPQLGVMFNKDEVEDPKADYKALASGTFGIGAGLKFRRNMGIETNFMYTILKQRYINPQEAYTQQFTYLKIPLLFTYNAHSNGSVGFTAEAGPQLGFLLKSKITDATDISKNGSTKNQFRPITFGALVCVGGSLRLSETAHFNLGIRFDGTFMNVEKTSYQNSVPGRDNTYNLNTGIQLSLKQFLRK